MNRRELVGFLAGIPAFALLADEVTAANEFAPEGLADDKSELGEVGTKLIFENEKVKVWEFALDPGEGVAMHTHVMDYLFHVYEGGTLEVSYPPEARAESRRIELKAGDVRFAKKGGRHTARNVSKDRYVEVLMELKQ